MIEETTVGFSSRNVSQCSFMSGGAASPAVAATGGPQEARNSRTRASASASRRGGGSRIHVLSWNAPPLAERNCSTHARMAGGWLTTAPIAPIPPAFATAAARVAGQAPAIGAIRIGSRRPYVAQNCAARSRGRTEEGRGVAAMVGDVMLGAATAELARRRSHCYPTLAGRRANRTTTRHVRQSLRRVGCLDIGVPFIEGAALDRVDFPLLLFRRV